MTKKEFRDGLKRNGITCDEFAAMTGRNVRSVYAYGVRTPIPFHVRLIIRLFDERGKAWDLIRK